MANKDVEILKEGVLRKQGGRLKTWKSRHFVLYADGCMRYYSCNEKKKCIDQFNLHGHELNVIPNDALDIQNDKFYFEIRSGNGARLTDGHDFFLLCASTEEEREEWVFHLRKVLYRHRGGAIFGHSLAETMAVDGRKGYIIPRIVQDLVEFIEKAGVDSEGIFRLSGRKKLVTQLMDEYDRGLPIDLSEHGVDVNTAASVLKNYLRKLPEPLIPFDRFEEMSTYGSKLTLPLDDKSEVYELVIKGLSSLPKWNYNLLKYLINFFARIAAKESVNKMSAKNLAAIHAPNILRMENENAELMATVNLVIVETTLGFIENYDILFKRDYEINEIESEASESVENEDSSVNTELQKSEHHTHDKDKIEPSSELCQVMLDEMRTLLINEQTSRTNLEKEIEELKARNRDLEYENRALRQKLEDTLKRVGNLA